ncbi:MAG TPA: hypothetical protein VFL57_18085 [Bryobacteraceae bacterium]|nr:hypothetical protein [Bryobacteraceae bacterium]
MNWTRTETLALAAQKCVVCHGVGMRSTRGKASAPCNCALRGIFRICLSRFRQCIEERHCVRHASLEYSARRSRRLTWDGRKNEEFAADFYLISKRTLSEDEFRIFKYHFLLGADWRLCCRKLRMERGDFFHSVYRIEQKLGRAYRETAPFALYPIDEYFRGSTGEANAIENMARPAARPDSLSNVVPINRAA